MDRIDIFPTREIGGFPVRAGTPLPFGASLVPGGVNFSIFSSAATSCDLVLFRKREREPFAILPFPEDFRIGDVFSMVVFGLEEEELEYGYRMDGPWDPEHGHRFDKGKILMDPYARAIGGRDVWGEDPDWSDPYPHRARIVPDDFDWQGDRPLRLPTEDLLVYEMHVRGFTRHESSGVKYPGTFAGMREKIPHLKELGVNCVELMPIHEYDEFENSRISEATGERLLNYWGYSNVGFFAPKAGLAASGRYSMQVDELKTLVRNLHQEGIEVILDVVFNHTAEGDHRGPYISYRGLDNKTYYMLTPDGWYYNFSGCGNTLNCNNPVVRGMILDCLRYWASEYHIDGFRFDLASILGRAQNGAPMAAPPLLESLAFDPILSRCKLIAEAWDAGGLYQVGSFPSWGRWAEWNGKYRDDMRDFLRGEAKAAGGAIQRIMGSPDLYAHKGQGTSSSVNFLTCHDGFCLMDLVSYNGKHNEANGENNNDGSNDNASWNCGWEGPSTDPWVNALRLRQIKNAWTLLMVSQGIPMVLMGDEMGNTQQGNNNCYCQDSPISWLDWTDLERNGEIHRFAKGSVAFRMAHPVLRNSGHFQHRDYVGSGIPDISWHGTKAWNASWSDTLTLAFMLCGKHAKGGSVQDDTLYCAINMHWEMHGFELPDPPPGTRWHVAINTAMGSGQDVWESGAEPPLGDAREILVADRSIMVLVAR
ncbi:MAG: glycogen debranching protein GlgX [Fibrobacteria bacterium]|nr:glycogen debranching protein GlgX [Fibrobacteria bacterium]